MPTSQQTFADRLGRANTVAAAINLATPVFAPADITLNSANFAPFVTGLGTMNEGANAANDAYATAVRQRLAMVKDIKGRALRAFRYVLSNKAWAANASSLKLTYDKLRANKPKAAKLPPSGSPGEVAKAIKSSEQSFSDLESLLMKFVVGLGKITGYAPAAAELTLSALQSLSAAYATKNQTMASLAEDAALKIRSRQTGFLDLKSKTKDIKNAVLAQYGPKSATYTSIKGLSF